MRRLAIFLLMCPMANPQGRPRDWPSFAGDAQRTGWETIDTRITKDNVKEFQLVLKRKLENAPKGEYSLTAPVMIGLLISYRGFKELAFVAGSSGHVWAIDADLDRIFWEKQFDPAGPCAGGAPALALIPPVNFAARPRPAGVTPKSAARATPSGAPPARPNRNGLRPTFSVSSDGKLHWLNTSTGDDLSPPAPFLPAHASASSLTVVDNTVYTTTSPDCGEVAVWAMDISGPDSKTPPVAKFSLEGGNVSRFGGLAVGADGTVYVQTGGANARLLALGAKDLKLKQYFALPGTAAATPVVFAHKGRDLIVAAGADGRLYLLDSKSVGGDDHQTPLYRTPPVASGSGGIWGGLSSWQDTDGTRWVLAPVRGPVHPDLHAEANNGDAPTGAIVAFKVEDKDQKTVLTPAWVSRDMSSPEPPGITSGVVFALAAGGAAGEAKSPTHATLYALDAATGKEMYSTGDQVTAPGNLTGLTVANGRVFFTTTDGTLYGFGLYMER